jgi:bis(5'-nucleosyl)-tetraphosphatase (symmetrical)
LPRYAVGDIQGCYEPLHQLLQKLRFSADRDVLYFVGDLVNRGPQSLAVLRFVRALGANARTVLGNHDLHLLAHHFDPARALRDGDTLQEVLAAPDREQLMDWLIQQPLLIRDDGQNDVFLHAGLVPQWTVDEALRNATDAMTALRAAPADFLAQMYGNKPDKWNVSLPATERRRFTINVLTRLRYCASDGTINLKLKGAPSKVEAPWRPWFEHETRRSNDVRIIFGHWSTLGFIQRTNVLALDTGCIWGGALTAVNLDDPDAPPIQQPCKACQPPGSD